MPEVLHPVVVQVVPVAVFLLAITVTAEVAQLAGVSTDYYTRLEKGSLGGASESVLEAISKALHLDEAEHARARSPVPPLAGRGRSARIERRAAQAAGIVSSL